MKKIPLFAFQGDSMCFIHVLLNSLDLKAKGFRGQAPEVHPGPNLKNRPEDSVLTPLGAEGFVPYAG